VRLGVIHNADAGDARSQAELAGLLRRHGHDVCALAHPSDGVARWRHQSLDLVVAAGGDGTIAAALCAVADSRLGVPLAMLPMGTANNIATSLDVSDHLDAAVGAWPRHQVRLFDLGVATGSWGQRCFVESVGGGLVTHGIVVMERRHYTSPTPESQVARARSAHADVLAELEPVRWRFALDGRQEEGDFLLLEVLNISMVGPNLWLATASPFDGQFTVVGIPTDHRRAWLDRLRGGSAPLPPPCIWHAREVVLQVTDRLHVDDTVVDASVSMPVRARLEARRVPVLLPRRTSREADCH
jgi:diacylglycerol kinase (ATP)